MHPFACKDCYVIILKHFTYKLSVTLFLHHSEMSDCYQLANVSLPQISTKNQRIIARNVIILKDNYVLLLHAIGE